MKGFHIHRISHRGVCAFAYFLGLTGLHLHMASLESVLAGAVEFATPNDPGSLAERGAVFKLAAEAKDAWLRWSPEIPIGETP